MLTLFLKLGRDADARWRKRPTCAKSRRIWSTYNKIRSRDLLCHAHANACKMPAVCTGNWSIQDHISRFGIPYNSQSCGEEEETVGQFLCKCPALATTDTRWRKRALLSFVNELLFRLQFGVYSVPALQNRMLPGHEWVLSSFSTVRIRVQGTKSNQDFYTRTVQCTVWPHSKWISIMGCWKFSGFIWIKWAVFRIGTVYVWKGSIQFDLF